MSSVLLCINQNDNNVPYKFEMTSIQVYTFEEALYHTYNFWKESIDEFLSEAFIIWVKGTLNQKYIAAKISELNDVASPGERLLKFLSIANYYDNETLAKIKVELSVWEQQKEWERLKDMGDMLMNKKEPYKAYQYYKKAFGAGENYRLLNNMGVCLMEMELFDEALTCLSKAYEMEKTDFDVLINYAEALIYKNDFRAAYKILKKAEGGSEKAVVSYLYGRMCQQNNNLSEAQSYYIRAANLEYDPFYYYALIEVYVKLRKFNSALEALENIKVKDREFFVNQAEVYSAFEDYSAAVKCMEKAVLFGERNNPNLWAMLARYLRLNYDIQRAERAASTALNFDKTNRLARLEMARIMKAQGKFKDYQNNLSLMLDSYKKEYRDIMNSTL